MSMRVCFSAILLKSTLMIGLAFIAAGCGGGSDNLSTGRVSGKVTHDGKPVTGGSVTFAQASKPGSNLTGKPAAGEVQADGSFTLTTYASGDGAIIGKGTIGYTAPAVEIDEAQHKEDSKPPVSPYAGLVPKSADVEVKSGSNTIDIELVPNPKAESSGS